MDTVKDSAWADDTQQADAVGETLPAAPRTTTDDPNRVGRFVVLERIGAGGMGVVYAAYDQQLDRKIAIKLLHGGQQDDQAQIRIMREAQAMARVSHPNVAAVYEVGTHGGCVFLAMELVRGQTLGQWARADSRPIDEIVEVFVQAGRGLATAHAAGLVHRDFKPANALVGDDGRVRVLDFGLARPGEGTRVKRTAVPGEIERHDRLSVDVTIDGQLVGTPAYIAPEQYGGAPADARSDQFAFCVALFELAFGERPFVGETLPQMSAAVLGGQITAVVLKTPRERWLHEVAVRGLSTAPEDRFPSMDALLAVLTTPQRRSRAPLWLGVGALALAVGAGAMAWSSAAPGLAACDRSLAELEWNDTERAALRDAMPLLSDADRDRAVSSVDRYVERWQVHAESVCAPVHAAQTEPVQTAREQRQCLRARSVELASLVRAVRASEPTVQTGASRAVLNLHPPARCMETALRAALPAPPPADALHPTMEVQLTLGAAQARLDDGDAPGALQLARDARRSAQEIDVPSLRADAMFVLSYMHYSAGLGPEAYPLAEEATFASAAADDGYRHAINLAWLAIAAHLLGRTDEAVESKARADGAAQAVVGDPEVEAWLAFFEGTVPRTTPAQRLPRLRRAFELYSQVYGARSQEVAGTAHNLGDVLIDAGQLDEAFAHVDQRRQLLERELGADVIHVAWEYASLARIRGLQGRLDEAIALTERAVANVDAKDPDNGRLRAVALAARGDIEARAGRAEAAIASMRAALEFHQSAIQNPHEIAALRVQIGLTWLAQGNPAAARENLQAARASLVEVLSQRELRDHDQFGLLTTLSAWSDLQLGREQDARAALQRLPPDDDSDWVAAWLRLRLATDKTPPDPTTVAHVRAQIDAAEPNDAQDARWRVLRAAALAWLQDPIGAPAGEAPPSGDDVRQNVAPTPRP